MSAPTAHPNKCKLEPSPSLSYVIGTSFGDGYLYEKNHAIRLEVKDFDFAQAFQKALFYLLGKSYAIKSIGNGFFRIQGFSIILFNFLKQKDLGKFTAIIEDYPSEFIKGLADSDGWVHKGIHIAKTNKNLLEYTGQLLYKKFLILSKIHIRDIRGKISRKRDGSLICSKQVIYYLDIEDKTSMETFSNKIGFTIARKQNGLEDLLATMGNARTPIRIVNELVPLMKELRASGLIYEKIASQLNIAPATVHQRLNGRR